MASKAQAEDFIAHLIAQDGLFTSKNNKGEYTTERVPLWFSIKAHNEKNPDSILNLEEIFKKAKKKKITPASPSSALRLLFRLTQKSVLDEHEFILAIYKGSHKGFTPEQMLSDPRNRISPDYGRLIVEMAGGKAKHLLAHPHLAKPTQQQREQQETGMDLEIVSPNRENPPENEGGPVNQLCCADEPLQEKPTEPVQPIQNAPSAEPEKTIPREKSETYWPELGELPKPFLPPHPWKTSPGERQSQPIPQQIIRQRM